MHSLVSTGIEIDFMTERPACSVTVSTGKQRCTGCPEHGLVAVFTDLAARIEPHQVGDMAVRPVLVHTDPARVVKL